MKIEKSLQNTQSQLYSKMNGFTFVVLLNENTKKVTCVVQLLFEIKIFLQLTEDNFRH